MRIQLFLCGGTIDSTFHPTAYRFQYNKTHFYDLISRARLNEINLNITELFLKDSGDMTDSDRQLVVKKCEETAENMILIAHGTDTLTQTAEAILEHLPAQKTVVLFGSMLPFELTDSDAQFNFGAAVAAVQLLPPGVFVVMNGQAWPAGRVIKDRQRGVFVTSRRA
jgi:L-asparaginase